MKDQYLNAALAKLTLADEFRRISENGSWLLERLQEVAKPPLDMAGLLSACKGGNSAIECALATLVAPNTAAISIHENIVTLTKTVGEVYSQQSIVDAESRYRRLSEHQAWLLMQSASAHADHPPTALKFVVGVALAVYWKEGKPIPSKFCQSVRRALSAPEISPATLLTILDSSDPDDYAGWHKKFKEIWTQFRLNFDSSPTGPKRAPSIQDIARSQFVWASAVPSFRKRAAVLDVRCLTWHELDAITKRDNIRFGGCSIQESRVILWFVMFCGLPVQHISKIPLSRIGDVEFDAETYCIHIDLQDGCLVRDYSVLANDAATPEGLDGEPATFTLRLPLPEVELQTLNGLALNKRGAQCLGDLIPQVLCLDCREALLNTNTELCPSLARLRNSIGVFLRQGGMDNLQVACITGDFGHTAKSKIYYARFTHHEVRTTAATAYRKLGFSTPFNGSKNNLSFGCQVVPPTALLRAADQANIETLSILFPGKHSTEHHLIDFHNSYVRALGFRLCLGLALREFSEFPLLANWDYSQVIQYVTEKSSAKRTGGMAALVPSSIRKDIEMYFAHCESMYQRLRKKWPYSEFTHRLADVTAGRCVPLLFTCSLRRTAQSLSSSNVLLSSQNTVKLTTDFGRKWLENRGRELGWRSSDIDRVLRHQVLGQESNSGLSDGSEQSWANRVLPLLNKALLEVFQNHLTGLVRGGK